MSKSGMITVTTTECEPWAVMAAVAHVRQAAREHGFDGGLIATCQLEVQVDYLPGSDVEAFKRVLSEMSLADTFEVTGE